MDNFNNKCMLCLLHNKHLKNILSPDEDGIEIGAKFNYALNENNITTFYVKIVNYKMYIHKHICLDCLKDLNHVYKFKQKCMRNLRKLSDYVERAKARESSLGTQKKQNNKENIKTKPGKNQNKTSHLRGFPQENNFEGVTQLVQDKNLEERPDKNIEEPAQNKNIHNPTQDKNIEAPIQDKNIQEATQDKNIQTQDKNIQEPTQDKNVQEPIQDKNIEEVAPDESADVNIEDDDESADVNIEDDSSNSYSELYNKQEPKNTENASENKGDVSSSTAKKNKQFECDICHKIFKRNFGLKQHKRTHTNEKPFKCSTCGKNFGCRSNFFRHRAIHTGLKPFKCEICDKRFNNITGVKAHMRAHAGDRPFKCEICHKAFKWISNLRQHKHYHKDEKPFKCQYCPHRSTFNCDLKRHIQSMHLRTPRRRRRQADKVFSPAENQDF